MLFLASSQAALRGLERLLCVLRQVDRYFWNQMRDPTTLWKVSRGALVTLPLVILVISSTTATACQ
jgi:hypothetical protein